MSANRSAAKRSAALSAVPRRCTPSATPTCCSRALRPISTPPSSCASSSATPLRLRRACSNSTPTRCAFPPPAWRLPKPPPLSKRWNRSTSPRLWPDSASRLAITCFASRSWSKPSVPNAPPNWPSPQPAGRAPWCRSTANTACRSNPMPLPQADFQSLKQRIPIDWVLAHYGVKLRPAGPHTRYGACPLPTHTSRQSRESFSVNLSRRVWSCHSASCIAAREGRIGGHVIDLVAIMERCGLRQAGLRLQDWFGGRATHPPPVKESARTSAPTACHPPLGFTLQGIDTCHPYLE